MFRMPLLIFCCAMSCASLRTGFAQSSRKPQTPEGFQQILPRGGIPAINDPQYVTADEAQIKDDAFVLGIVIDATPLAYSLNLLNRHEVVNDTIGKTNFAAVW